jgi:hypothetical protein
MGGQTLDQTRTKLGGRSNTCKWKHGQGGNVPGGPGTMNPSDFN